jgi:acetyl-CoA C-acetyltransferase
MRGHDIRVVGDPSVGGERSSVAVAYVAPVRIAGPVSVERSTTILALPSHPATYRRRPAFMPKTVILGSARTPIGKMGGSLSTLDATELGGLAIAAALERAGVEPEQVEHVVMGQVLQAGQGQIPSRQAQIKAGIPKEVSSETINKVCASGLRASAIIDQAIRAGDMSVGVGGGMESMSKAPYLLPQARFGYRMGDATMLDAMVHDGLTNPFSGKQMFVEATEVGDQLEITRADMDRWALRSHELALKATDEGRMSEEIVSVTIKNRKDPAHPTLVEIDEGPRRDTSLEKLAALPGLVGKEGSHTAGNSPGVNDGGGALVLASEEWAQENGKEALAEIVAHAQSANDFAYLATTPASAAKKALEKAGLQPGDIDLWEINEAFASVTLNSIRMLGIDEDRVNVNGGAVALGHPIGASGARILGALVHELRRRGGGYGCAAICSGGGQGDALILKV